MANQSLIIGDKTILTGFSTVTGGINLNGLQIRYGSKNCNHNTATSVTFSTAFSNACLAVVACTDQNGFSAASTVSTGAYSKTGFTAQQFNMVSADMRIAYIAIGY